MPRSTPPTVLSLCALLLGGCAAFAPKALPSATGGQASGRPVAPPTRRYPLALGQVATGGAPVARVAPIYPPALRAACPASVEVPAQLVIDRGGRVTAVRVDGTAATSAARRPFIDAVRTAAMQWSFQPLQVARWAADADGNSHLVDREALPYSLSYRFRFTCRDGRTQVGATPASAR